MDPITVCEYGIEHGLISPNKKEEWITYLFMLSDEIPSIHNLMYYANIVREKSDIRATVRACRETIEQSYTVEDADVFLDGAEQRILDIRNDRNTGDSYDAGSILKTLFKEISANWERQKNGELTEITGVPSGLRELDKLTCGFQRKDLIITAGRPSMGKTSLVLEMIFNAVLSGSGAAALFSLEMSKEQIMYRMLSSLARVDGNKLRRGAMEDSYLHRLTQAASDLSQMPIEIYDEGEATVWDVRQKSRQLKKKHGKLSMIAVDYLQLLHGNNPNNREQEVAGIAKGLKNLAKELDCPVVALAQLNRSLERRPDKRPVMSDLRESGAIEQAADLIIFVYRDEVYCEDTEDRGIAELIIGKQRNGPIGTARTRFLKEYTRFENLPEENQW